MKEKTSIKKNQILILIELDYFSEFGDINKLKKIYEIYIEFYDSTKKRFKVQFNKEKIIEMGLHVNLIKKYAEKETDKMFTKVDVISWLKDEFSIMQYEQTTIYDKARYQLNRLDDVYITNENASGIAMVTDVDTKYSPRLAMYSLKNGNTVNCKIEKRKFSNYKLKKGDIVKIISTSYKHKKKKVEGEWIETNELELWINSYNIID